MIKKLVREASQKNLGLAPLIGIGCPGVIDRDGFIEKGGQNLPGNSEKPTRFNLPKSICALVPNAC